jgi:4-hydroxythreonine-4-phosphate dehydrogenase
MNLKNNLTLKSSKIRVGLTIGDPAGIGPAIALKALKILGSQVDVTVIGSGLVLAKAAQILKIKHFGVKLIDLDNVNNKKFVFGKVSALNGKASLEYLDVALGLLWENKIDCLVTCPISKEAINLAGAKFSGHTEYFSASTGCKDLVMLLLNNKIKFSLVTRHVALSQVSSQLTKKNLAKNISDTIQGLREMFLIKKPKIVVCGINPHASDNGVIGTEENMIMVPVIKRLNKTIKQAVIIGPLSADTAIVQAVKGGFDCVVSPYHDQALIALKLTDFDSGVNLTLGLPFVRTSPLHGTAFDIAKNPVVANPHSLVCAIKLAIKCRLNQKKV